MTSFQRRAANSFSRTSFAVTVVMLAGLSVSAQATETAPAIEQAVHAPNRSPANLARDGARHPAEELAFFGVTPTATVVEIWPGKGYWTEILAPLLHDRGTYYAALGAADGNKAEAFFAKVPGFSEMLAANPAVYGKLHLTQFSALHPDPAPAGSADFVLTFRNLHNWMAAGDAGAQLAAINRVLKAGGVLGIEDHRANTRSPQDPKAANGYVRQDYAISLIEKAGFKFVGASETNANPRDTADWPEGVWTLPPTFALGKTDRAKYEQIGEADNFVLKFVKIAS